MTAAQARARQSAASSPEAGGLGADHDHDREAWARVRYAAMRDERPRFESAQHEVDVYL